MNYITRSISGVSIHKTPEVIEINRGFMAFLNELCLINGSSYSGRRASAKYVLKKTSNLPIYVSNDTLLFPTESIRNTTCKMVNYMEISHIIKENEGCKIVFKDCSILRIIKSFSRVSKQLKSCERFSSYMENEKKVFTLSLYK